MSFVTDVFSKTGAGALAIGAAIAFGANDAQAVTVTFDNEGFQSGTLLSGQGAVNQNNLGNGTASIDFIWGNADEPGNEYVAYSQFTTNSSFRLTFDDYAPNADLTGEEGARSGFQIYAGTFGGTLTPLLPHDPNTEPDCGSLASSNFGSSDCVLVTGPDNEQTAFVTPPVTYDITNGAGSYVLMFVESSEPNNGSAEFIVSAIPLPAGGLLLLTALGGFGGIASIRRRRKAT